MTTALSPADRARLTKLLGMLGSDHPGERDNAGVAAHRLIQSKGLAWADILATAPAAAPQPLISWRETCAELQKRLGSLRVWEKRFISDLPHFTRISAKQRSILAEIAERVLRRAA
jgi:hypothetical protein